MAALRLQKQRKAHRGFSFISSHTALRLGVGRWPRRGLRRIPGSPTCQLCNWSQVGWPLGPSFPIKHVNGTAHVTMIGLSPRPSHGEPQNQVKVRTSRRALPDTTRQPRVHVSRRHTEKGSHVAPGPPIHTGAELEKEQVPSLGDSPHARWPTEDTRTRGWPSPPALPVPSGPTHCTQFLLLLLSWDTLSLVASPSGHQKGYPKLSTCRSPIIHHHPVPGTPVDRHAHAHTHAHVSVCREPAACCPLPAPQSTLPPLCIHPGTYFSAQY